MAVPVLGECQVGHGPGWGRTGQVAAAGLAVKYRHDLHSGLFGGNIGVAGAGMADDADVLIEVDGVHLGQLAGAGDGLEDGHGPWPP